MYLFSRRLWRKHLTEETDYVEYTGRTHQEAQSTAQRKCWESEHDICATAGLGWDQAEGSKKLLKKEEIYGVPNEFTHIPNFAQ